MIEVPKGPRRRRYITAGYERLVNQLIHWCVAIIIATFIFILAVRSDLDHASVTALYGAILGHVGTAAVQRQNARRHSDDGPDDDA